MGKFKKTKRKNISKKKNGELQEYMFEPTQEATTIAMTISNKAELQRSRSHSCLVYGRIHKIHVCCLVFDENKIKITKRRRRKSGKKLLTSNTIIENG